MPWTKPNPETARQRWVAKCKDRVQKNFFYEFYEQSKADKTEPLCYTLYLMAQCAAVREASLRNARLNEKHYEKMLSSDPPTSPEAIMMHKAIQDIIKGHHNQAGKALEQLNKLKVNAGIPEYHIKQRQEETETKAKNDGKTKEKPIF